MGSRRAAPSSMAAAIKGVDSQEKTPPLSLVSMAELKREKQGFKGALYTAKILNNSPSYQKDKILVEYESESNQPFTKSVDISSIRPLPPPPAADRPPKQEIPDIADYDEQAANVDCTGSNAKNNLLEQSNSPIASLRSKKLNKPAPEIEETLSNNAKKFKKENNIDSEPAEESCAAAMLLNSREQVTDSGLAKCSTCDLDANLPMNKGKNTSPNRHEAGEENRMDGSMKKRGKETDAQVIGQLGAAGSEDGYFENLNKSYVQSESELAKNQETPFTKRSSHWQFIDSLEIFRCLPQKPHFGPLSEDDEATREGIAMGHMLNFATVVEKASKLRIDKPGSVFESYLQSLADLEKLGFDVKAVADCIKKLLSLKRRQEQLDSGSKELDRKKAECNSKKAKLAEDINAINKMISKLKKKQAIEVSEKAKEDSKSKFLEFNALTIEDNIMLVKEKFKVNTASLGRYL